MAMERENLMIGDWVSVKSCAKPNFYKISKLDPNMESSVYPIHVERPAEGLSYTFLDEDDIEPIPLTKEILENNGFRRAISDCFEMALFTEKNKDFFIKYFAVSKTLYVNDLWFRVHNIHYVHELQHALRLCKIEKEIIL